MAADAPEAESPPPEPGAGATDPDFAAYADEPVPQMAVGSAGKAGELELTFATDAAGRTRLVHDFARVPYHVSGTLDHDPHPDAATVFVQSPTGGIAQGDRLRASVEVGPDAVAHVSTGSATKVQSMDANYAEATVELSVGEGGHLDYLPEPTILHADARYRQELTLRLAPGGTAVVGEVVVAGRLARGERFDFERYGSRLRAVGPDGPLFADATDLTPERDDPTAPGVMADFSVYGTCFVVDPGGDSAALSDAVHERLQRGEARGGATALPNEAGVAVRVLGDRAETVRAGLVAAWDVARRELVGAPAPDRRTY